MQWTPPQTRRWRGRREKWTARRHRFLGIRKKKKNKRKRRMTTTTKRDCDDGETPSTPLLFLLHFVLLSLWRPRQISWVNCHHPVLLLWVEALMGLPTRKTKKETRTSCIRQELSVDWAGDEFLDAKSISARSQGKAGKVSLVKEPNRVSWPTYRGSWAQYGTESISRNRKLNATQNGLRFFDQWRRCRDKGRGPRTCAVNQNLYV